MRRSDHRASPLGAAGALLTLAALATPGRLMAASAAIAALLAPEEATLAGAPVETLYLANEGVVLSDGERRVAIDALFGDGLADYPAVPQVERGALERAEGDYGQIDLLLATHVHADHFDAAAVARHLSANADARFVSTPAAVAAVAAVAEKTALPAGAPPLAPRLTALLPPEGGRETVEWRGVRVTAFNLHHGRGLARPVEHLVFLVELGGRRILHLGDTEANADELTAALGGERGTYDLVLVAFWRLLSAEGRAELERALEPRRMAAFHLPVASAPAESFGESGSLGALRRELLRELPALLVLDISGARSTLGEPVPGREGVLSSRRGTSSGGTGAGSIR